MTDMTEDNVEEYILKEIQIKLTEARNEAIKSLNDIVMFELKKEYPNGDYPFIIWQNRHYMYYFNFVNALFSSFLLANKEFIEEQEKVSE